MPEIRLPCFDGLYHHDELILLLPNYARTVTPRLELRPRAGQLLSPSWLLPIDVASRSVEDWPGVGVAARVARHKLVQPLIARDATVAERVDTAVALAATADRLGTAHAEVALN